MNLSIIIPAYPPHFKFISKIINNLLKSTVLPKEIILALSEINQTKALKLCEEEIKLCNEKNVNLIISSDNNKNFAGGNRNRGFKSSSCDIVSFVDIDDETHIQKIEIIKYIFKIKPNTNMLLHNYSNKNKLELIDNITNINIYNYNDGFFKKDIKDFCNKRNFRGVHRGHATFHRRVLKDLKYQENMCSGQDSEFTKRIHKKYGNTLFLDLKLILYTGSKVKIRETHYGINN